MHADPSIAVATLCAFLVVLARVSGAFIFVPMPGFGGGPEPVRVLLSLSLTVAMFPLWPVLKTVPETGQLVGWLLAEAAMGLMIGLVVGFLAETFALFGQMVSLHSGHSFASTIDPNTQADAGLIVVVAQSVAGLLFFTFGLHREVLRIFARSLETHPPGSFVISAGMAEGLIRLGATIFSTGLRLAFPVIGLLVMVDLALALLGRINAQLQLNSLAFPAKTLATLALLAILLEVAAHVYRDYAARLLEAIPALMGA
ncbi:MAG TPA: flagellar biosynthetic protein FliR [Bryobacteraceae bacterium]|nr:flagellar biosynthetic protein FliR [Bryobacteraceae bacterium]